MTRSHRSAEQPKVSIGLPTYNRAPLLDKAIASALGQTFDDIELVIADNASTDGTSEVCSTWAARDRRVRVLRHAENLGPTANFNSLFAACGGQFVLMLADDDRLDSDYVERCLAEFENRPDVAVVAGTARYVRGTKFVREGPVTSLLQGSADQRVLAYFRSADDGPFYGLVRGEVLRAAGPMPNVLANDWLHIARLACSGPIVMILTTHVTRELDGTSASIENILETFGSRAGAGRIPHLIMAGEVTADIVWRSPVRHELGHLGGRVALATRCAWAVINWPSLAWHLTAPTFRGLARRPRGRPFARAYDKFTRALGAGRRQ